MSAYLARTTLALLAGLLSFGPQSSVHGQATVPPARYEATLESLNAHPLPKWFDDAKLGIFVHWGLYSVPGWATVEDAVYDFDDPEWASNNPYAEWYRNTMQVPGSHTAAYHKAHYGSADYYDFADTFNREITKWNPDAWATLFADAGAKYVVLTTKHHEGFTLWPSSVPNPTLRGSHAHAKRDIVGDLGHALEQKNIRYGLYYSGGFDWSFLNGPFISSIERDASRVQTQAYADYVDAQYRELIERYHPAILWNDIAYPAKGHAYQLFAEFYNRIPDGVVNDRWSPFEHSDLTTPEYKSLSKISAKKWEECRGLGDSFGYNRAEGVQQTLTAGQLIHLLVDVVSKNGNLLLDVGPEADGSIPPLQVERLHQLGAWLKVNGEAIYGSKPWSRAEGRTEDGTDVRFTSKGTVLYATLLGKPRELRITLPAMPVEKVKGISLLGNRDTLAFEQDGTFLRVRLPADLPDSSAYVLKIEQ